VFVWQALAVLGLVGTVVGVAVSRAVDLCGSVGPVVLVVAWFIAPVVAIASVVAIAVVSRETHERIVAVVLGIVLTGTWLFALVWASVGEAVQRSGC
jgi:hypothetical protein